MSYIDGFVVPVPNDKKTAYREVATKMAEYFKELGATSEGARFYFGTPVQVMEGKPKEVFTQVFNNAFPAGTISVDDAVRQMNAAYK